MQAERQPQYPRLYSLRGFCYCDLLLADAERAAWDNRMAHAKTRRREEDLRALAPSREILEACDAVIERAEQALAWMSAWSGASILTIALDHLTLGRSALYGALLHAGESLRASQPVSERPDYVSAARDLITTHAYHRRDEELADAETNW